MFALAPAFLASGWPQDLQLMSVVVCVKMILFSPHSVHWTEIKLLFGFGISIFLLDIIIIITFLGLYFQFPHSYAFLHRLSLTGFTGIA
jgi:hypothetical protein